MVALALATAAYTWVVNFIVESANSSIKTSDGLDNAKQYALLILPILLGITFVSGVSNYAQRILANSIALNAVGKLQKQMFSASHRSDYTCLLYTSPSPRDA